MDVNTVLRIHNYTGICIALFYIQELNDHDFFSQGLNKQSRISKIHQASPHKHIAMYLRLHINSFSLIIPALKFAGRIKAKQHCTLRIVSSTSKKYFYNIIYPELN